MFLLICFQSHLLQNCHMWERVKLIALYHLQTNSEADRRLLLTLWQMEKLLIMSNFTFFHNVFNLHTFIIWDFSYFSKNVFIFSSAAVLYFVWEKVNDEIGVGCQSEEFMMRKWIYHHIFCCVLAGLGNYVTHFLDTISI